MIAVAALIATVVGIGATVRQGDRNDFSSRQQACLDAVEKYSANLVQLVGESSPITAAGSAENLRDELPVERFCLSSDLIDPHSDFAWSWQLFQHDTRLLFPELQSAIPDVKHIEQGSVYNMIRNCFVIRDWVGKQAEPGWWPWENRPKGAPKFDYSDSPPPFKDF